jgi:hypothetical protein
MHWFCWYCDVTDPNRQCPKPPKSHGIDSDNKWAIGIDKSEGLSRAADYLYHELVHQQDRRQQQFQIHPHPLHPHRKNGAPARHTIHDALDTKHSNHSNHSNPPTHPHQGIENEPRVSFENEPRMSFENDFVDTGRSNMSKGDLHCELKERFALARSIGIGCQDCGEPDCPAFTGLTSWNHQPAPWRESEMKPAAMEGAQPRNTLMLGKGPALHPLSINGSRLILSAKESFLKYDPTLPYPKTATEAMSFIRDKKWVVRALAAAGPPCLALTDVAVSSISPVT